MNLAGMFIYLGLCSEPGLFIQKAPAASGEDRAFVEVTAERESYFVQEPIRLVLRFGFDRAYFEGHALQQFHRSLDVPLQVEAPWIEDLPGTVLLSDEQKIEGGLTLALNDTMAKGARVGDTEIDGGTFTVLEIERSYLPLEAGVLLIPETRLHFAYTSAFKDDFLLGRAPVDRHEAVAASSKLALDIHPLPEEGRPEGFTGAVGRLSVQAEVHPVRVEVGSSVQLALHIRGEGNLEFFDPPELERLEGFHVYGRIEEKLRTRRTITYDLAPLAESVKEVPPIPFVFFDTTPPASYRTVTTAAVALEVLPSSSGPLVEPVGLVPGETDIFDLKPMDLDARETPRSRGNLPTAIVVIALLFPWVAALSLLLWLRARERELSDPLGARARGAAAAFKAQAANPRADLAEAFAEYLAARLGCTTAAVIAPGLVERLRAAGAREDLAAAAAAMLDQLVASRYGAGTPGASMQKTRELVDALETALNGGDPR